MPEATHSTPAEFDIALVGAGPVGLAFIRSLAGTGLRILAIERQSLDALERPDPDGREIALTHASRDILETLGAWQHIPEADVSRLQDAKIFNGRSPQPLHVTAALGKVPELGYFVPNHWIRRSLYASVKGQGNVQLVGQTSVVGIATGEHANTLTLSDGRQVRARLVVAADSRFSETRRMMGISANMHDFGRTMLVCRFAHELPHEHTTWQWFDYAQTLALLPLNGNQSNVVLTLPQHEMAHMLALDDEAFSDNITRRFAGRLGTMEKIGKPNTYPLVGVYANRFVGQRYALVGDAAVGMHPITAHGFNFGLQSQKRLADAMGLALRRHQDFASQAVLSRYEWAHRAATWPLYQTTNAIASLYTDERLPARVLREGALRMANAMTPFKRAIAAHLSQA